MSISIDPKPDNLVFEPGIYENIPEGIYHASNGISKSQLDRLARSPAHLKAYLEGHTKQTKAMEFGGLLHAAILTPDLMPDVAVRPEGMKFTTKEGKEWRDQHQKDGFAILTQEENNALEGMKDSVLNHQFASRILQVPGRTEVSLYATDEPTGVLRRGRIDLLPDRGNILSDIKSCMNASKEAFSRSMFTYRYFVQAAYYIDLAKAHGLDRPVFMFVCIEKEPPYACAVWQIEPEAIQSGREQYRLDLDLYAQCLETDTWPAYDDSDENRFVGLPDYATRKLETFI
jgi:hypothetical protein